MKCLRCGYCCIHLEVIIVDDPKLGVVENNLISKHTGDRCKHMRGDKPGEYSCAIHNEPWYEESPCFQFTQVEARNSNCRLGENTLKPKET